jgi:hypothetical protein
MGSSKERERKRVRNMIPRHVLIPCHHDLSWQTGMYDPWESPARGSAWWCTFPTTSKDPWIIGRIIPRGSASPHIWSQWESGWVPTVLPVPSTTEPVSTAVQCRHMCNGCAWHSHSAAVLSKCHAPHCARSAHTASNPLTNAGGVASNYNHRQWLVCSAGNLACAHWAFIAQ